MAVDRQLIMLTFILPQVTVWLFLVYMYNYMDAHLLNIGRWFNSLAFFESARRGTVTPHWMWCSVMWLLCWINFEGFSPNQTCRYTSNPATSFDKSWFTPRTKSLKRKFSNVVYETQYSEEGSDLGTKEAKPPPHKHMAQHIVGGQPLRVHVFVPKTDHPALSLSYQKGIVTW